MLKHPSTAVGHTPEKPLLAQIQALLLLCVVSLTTVLASAASAQVTLTFGTYAADKPTATVKKYRPFLSFLSERMSERLNEPVTIRMKVTKGYFQGIDSLANGEFDFARFGPASYVLAEQKKPGIRIVAMEANKGQKRFNGVVVVHRDSPITSLDELKHHSFAFGDELSTIGRYLAQSHLLDKGISGSDLSGFKYLGRHDLVGEAVGAGKFTAGALKESTFKKLVAKGVPIRVLFSFDNVTKPWLVSSQMPDRVFAAMQAVMLAPEFQDIFLEIASNSFLSGSDDDYDFVRQAMQHSLAF